MNNKKPDYLNNLDKLHLYEDKLLGWMSSKSPDETMNDQHWAAYCMEWEKQLGWLEERKEKSDSEGKIINFSR